MTTPEKLLCWCLVSLCVSLVCGCTTVTPTSTTKYPPVPVDKVEVLYEQPQRPHEVIGLINYSGGKGVFSEDSIHLIQHCKEAAAQLGADAVELDEPGRGWIVQTCHRIRKSHQMEVTLCLIKAGSPVAAE